MPMDLQSMLNLILLETLGGIPFYSKGKVERQVEKVKIIDYSRLIYRCYTKVRCDV